MVDTGGGARFRKKLTTSDGALGGKIIDSAISSHFSDVFDGQFELFPKMAIDKDGKSLEDGKAPIGNDLASISYLLQFPTVPRPSFGSADLDSIELNLNCEDMNYPDTYRLPDMEIYKFKSDLPSVGTFGKIRNRVNYWGGGGKPERTVVGSASFDGGPTISEIFDGNDSSSPVTFAMPSLYRGSGNNIAPNYYSTMEEAWEINDRARFYTLQGTKMDDISYLKTKNMFDDSYGTNWEGYGRVVRYELKDDYCRPTGAKGLKTTWGDDPAFFLPYYNYAYAQSNGVPGYFKKELIHDKNEGTSTLSTAEVSVDETVKYALESATITTDNSFFDNIWYTDMKHSMLPDGQQVITSVSQPHFSTVGGTMSGQVGRLYSRIDTDEDVKQYNFNGNGTGVMTMCLHKEIPKPLKLARKDGTEDELSNMRIRIKFMVNSMNKSHRSGNLRGDIDFSSGDSTANAQGQFVAGNNILRSFTAILSTRAPNGDGLGKYINKLNGGNITPTGPDTDTPTNWDGTWDAASFVTRKDDYNSVTSTGAGNSESRVNLYNGVSLMKFVHARGSSLPVDTDIGTDGTNTLGDHGNVDYKTPKQGQWITGTGVADGAVITHIPSNTQFKVSDPWTSEANLVNLIIGDGRLSAEQKNDDPDDGVFTLFHSGNSDGSTRNKNYWDGMYQGDTTSMLYKDIGWPTDYIPFIHKQAGADGGRQSLKRDGTSFANDSSMICSHDPDVGSYIKLEDEISGLAMRKKEWYYLDAYINQTNAYITWVVTDTDGIVLGSVRQAHSGSSLSSSVNHAGAMFPNHLTLWVNNVKVGRSGGTGRGEHIGEGGIYSTYMDSEVDILIDNITISNFEPKVNNSTYVAGRKTVPAIKISGTSEEVIPDLSSTPPAGDTIPILQTNNRPITVPSYISWGMHADKWETKTNNIFLGGFKSTNSSMEDATDADKRLLFGGESATDANSQIRFFTTTVHSNHPMGFGAVSKGNEDMDNGPNMNDHINIGQSAVRDGLGDVMMVDSFTKKGFITVDKPTFDTDASGAGNSGVWTAKENPMFSTKILELSDVDPRIIKVANPDTLKAYKDDEFIIYRAGYSWDNDFKRTGLGISSITDDGIVTLTHPKGTRNPSSADSNERILHQAHLHELYICPEKFWLICEIYNETADNDLLPDKSYTHSFVTNNNYTPKTLANNKGLTYNESVYSDTTLVSNKWNHQSSSDNYSLLEYRVDYGFGAYSDEKSEAYDGETGLGYINKIVPKEGENIIDLEGLVIKEKKRLTQTDENVTFLIKSAVENSGGSTITTTKYDDSSKHPSLTYVFRDELPTIEDFSVQPFEEDPYFPEYTWKTPDEDLWYGFLILDNEIIEHQYHKAYMHIPLNEKPSGQMSTSFDVDFAETFDINRETFAYTYVRGGNYVYSRYSGDERVGTTREKGGAEFPLTNFSGNLKQYSDVEGLAGNCIRFNGSAPDGESVLAFPAYKYSEGSSDTNKENNELSIVAHFTVDSLTTIDEQENDKAYIVDASNDAFSIWVDKDGKVNASVRTDDASTTCTLISAYTVPVANDIPTNVILTVDTGISTGNCKLFVNGRLEDQTGRKNTDGSSNNWKEGQKIEPVDGHIVIGHEYQSITNLSASKNHFNGKIEEIVLYKIAIYPVNPKDGKATIYKPIEELTDASAISAGRPINAKLFIKDYHNIRGTTVEEVSQTSQVTIKKSGLGLKTN